MKRLCFLTTSYPDYPGSYRGGFVRHAALELVRRGYAVSVVTPRIYQRSRRFEQNGGERVYRFPFLSEEKLLVQYERIPIIRMATYMLSGFLNCLRVVRRDRCQLIHAHFVIPTGLIAVLAGRVLKVPVIVQAHGSDVTKYAGMNRWLTWLTAFTARNADHIIAVSDQLRTLLIKKFGASADRITVRSCGVDMNQFKPIPRDEARERLRLSKRARILLFVGALTPYKGVEHLLTAVTSMAQQETDFLLLIVGEGPLREQLIGQTRHSAMGNKIRFVGSKPNEEMPLWYNAADIFVLPSLREGSPISLLEALSCERPVVVSRAGGMPKVIQDGENGFLVNIADPVDLADKLALLLGDSTLQQRFSSVARETVLRRGGIQDEVDTWESLYRQLGVNDETTLSVGSMSSESSS